MGTGRDASHWTAPFYSPVSRACAVVSQLFSTRIFKLLINWKVNYCRILFSSYNRVLNVQLPKMGRCCYCGVDNIDNIEKFSFNIRGFSVAKRFFLIYGEKKHGIIPRNFVVSSDAIVLYLYALWIYKTCMPITKIHQILSLGVPR